MKAQVIFDVSPEKILVRRGLGTSSRAQLRLAQSVRDRCDRYVPFDTGRLKGSAAISPDGKTLTYSVPYARAQYYGLYRHSDPKRGRFWDRRMLAFEGEGVKRDVITVTGGR